MSTRGLPDLQLFCISHIQSSDLCPKTFPRHAHWDNCVTQWAFGLTCSQEGITGSQHVTQSKHYLIPPHGVDYVDFATLTIICVQARTLTAYQPQWMHGTTMGIRVFQHGICMTSSRHISDAKNISQGKLVRVFDPMEYDEDDEDDE